MKKETLSAGEIDAMFSVMEPILAQQRFKNDRLNETLKDQRKGRGKLLLNPEHPAFQGSDLEGAVIVCDGKEYRIIFDDLLRGMRIKDLAGNETDQVHPGFWVDGSVFNSGKDIPHQPLSKKE